MYYNVHSSYPVFPAVANCIVYTETAPIFTTGILGKEAHPPYLLLAS